MQVQRVRSADPESAELADVALLGLSALEEAWRNIDQEPLVATFWHRVQLAIASRPVADLETAVNAARGLRDLRRRFPGQVDGDLDEVADRIERRAWERERRRLGARPC